MIIINEAHLWPKNTILIGGDPVIDDINEKSLSKIFKSVRARMLKSLAGCRTKFLFAVFCKIGALERNAY